MCTRAMLAEERTHAFNICRFRAYTRLEGGEREGRRESRLPHGDDDEDQLFLVRAVTNTDIKACTLEVQPRDGAERNSDRERWRLRGGLRKPRRRGRRFAREPLLDRSLLCLFSSFWRFSCCDPCFIRFRWTGGTIFHYCIRGLFVLSWG